MDYTVTVIFENGKAGSESSLLQAVHYIDVEFADVEAVDVFTVKVDHVGMGDAAEAFVCEEVVFGTPLEGFFADEAVVETVEMLDEVVAHVERELAARGVVQLGAEALGVYAVEL